MLRLIPGAIRHVHHAYFLSILEDEVILPLNGTEKVRLLFAIVISFLFVNSIEHRFPIL